MPEMYFRLRYMERRRFFMDGQIRMAMSIFMMSPGMKGITQVPRAARTLDSIIRQNQAVPKAYNTAVPRSMARNWRIRFLKRRMITPAMTAIGIKPMM